MGPYSSWPYVDRRRRDDRRGRATPILSRYALIGRRAGGRRRGEGRNRYVDLYRPGDVLICLGILILNILDAVFTLLYLTKGGEEANPLAQILLDAGPVWFAFSKAVVIGVCLLFLLVHKTFAFVRPALVAILVFYGALLVYHLFLQADLMLRGI